MLPFRCSSVRQASPNSHTYTLFDAAALATTSPLNLEYATAPDFTVLAFYKIFGYPDLAALVVRKPAGALLQRRRYFGGGTVDMIICTEDTWHAMKDPLKDARYGLHDTLEDGTLPFHAILALGHAFNVHKALFTSMGHISSHTAYLGALLHHGVTELRHFNGRPLITVYNDDSVRYGDARTTGATIAFNIQDINGTLIPYQHVERLADACDIYVRGGGLCNPGGIATYLGLSAADFHEAWAEGHRCGHPIERLSSGKVFGVVRVSLGAMSTKNDVDVFLKFLKDVFVNVAAGAVLSLVTTVKDASHSVRLLCIDSAASSSTKEVVLPCKRSLNFEKGNGKMVATGESGREKNMLSSIFSRLSCLA